MIKRILLVEDSKVQKLAGEKILHRAGYLVLLASDGEEGLRLARESRPDLIHSAHDGLFTSGTLGRYSKILNSVMESRTGKEMAHS